MWKLSKGHRPIWRNESQWEYCRKRQRNPKQELHWSEKCENSNQETEIIIENIWSIMLLLFSHQVVSGSPQSYGLQHTRLSLTISWSLRKFMSITSVVPSSHLILWSPLLLLPSTFPGIRDFSNESVVCIRWLKYWSLKFSVSPSNKDSGFISLKIDWFDLHAIQGTLRSLLQHHNLKASILRCSAFFIV